MLQSARILKVRCSLGSDVFVLDGFTGSEGLSRPFAYELELASLEHSIRPADVVGKPMGFAVQMPGLGERVFHGRVRSFRGGQVDPAGQRVYRAVVVPWLSFLERRSNCRIFQHKNAIEIATQIFDELGFGADFESAVQQAPPELEYCVQYRETDLDFVTRLFEEFGLFYYFRHEEGRHVLVLCDGKSAYFDCPEKEVPYDSGSLVQNHVSSWERDSTFTSGRWSMRDYDFTKSRTTLQSDVDTLVEYEHIERYEIYDHPGRFLDRRVGDAKVNAYIAGEELAHDLAHGESTCVTFTPGGKFTLRGHDVADENRTWLITEIRHVANEPSVRGSSGEPVYANSFTCTSATTLFRPARTARKPAIVGLQTALVVGPAGEELFTDEWGRIRVQFHWDREGKRDDHSSCWIRVAQPLAGKNFGAFNLPRIGQEVVVSFLDGDPDRPLVIGSVYNDQNPPPFDLPKHKTQSGLRSRSSPGGGPDNHNEIRCEDTKGSEQLFIQAEKDLELNVKHDARTTIGNDENIEVVNNRSTHVGAEEMVVIGANSTEVVGATKVLRATDRVLIQAGTSITLQCGASTIHMNQAGVISISGMIVNTTATAMSNIVAPVSTMTGAVLATVNGAITMINGVLTHVEGASLARVAGAKVVASASGELIALGAPIKLNS